jgi:glycerophosphoryl diester phosphodiesterase
MAWLIALMLQAAPVLAQEARTGELPPCALMLAHRGFPGYRPSSEHKIGFTDRELPENSLEALARAHELGFQVLEFDVTPTGDAQFVLSHDRNLRRLTGVDLRVRSHDLATVVELELAPGVHPVGLDRVFRTFEDQVLYDIELKSGAFDKRSALRLVSHIEAAGLTGQVVVSSFSPWVLRSVERAHPETPTALLVYAGFPTALGLSFKRISRADRLSLDERLYTPHRTARLLEAGWQLTTWTVDEPDRIAELQVLGVGAIMTNMVWPEAWPACEPTEGAQW